MSLITVYKSNNCGVCHTVVPRLQALARRKGIPIQIIDVDRCGKKCERIQYVPHIEYNGREVSASNLEKMLK